MPPRTRPALPPPRATGNGPSWQPPPPPPPQPQPQPQPPPPPPTATSTTARYICTSGCPPHMVPYRALPPEFSPTETEYIAIPRVYARRIYQLKDELRKNDVGEVIFWLFKRSERDMIAVTGSGTSPNLYSSSATELIHRNDVPRPPQRPFMIYTSDDPARFRRYNDGGDSSSVGEN